VDLGGPVDDLNNTVHGTGTGNTPGLSALDLFVV